MNVNCNIQETSLNLMERDALLIQGYLAKSLCSYIGYKNAVNLWTTLILGDSGDGEIADQASLAPRYDTDADTIEALAEGLRAVKNSEEPTDFNPWKAFANIGITVVVKNTEFLEVRHCTVARERE